MESFGLDSKLNILVDSLRVPKRWKEKADQIRNKIETVLKTNSRYSVDRCRLVGSVAKGTAIGTEADIDIVVYYNDNKENLEVLEEWKSVLPNHTKLKKEDITLVEIHGLYSLFFTMDDISFDLLAAKNRSNDDGGVDVELQQFRGDLRAVKGSGSDEGWINSPQSVSWMKRQGPFRRDVAILAKFWRKTLFYTGVKVQSMVFELIGVAAAMEEETEAKARDRPKSIASAFTKFIGLMLNICTMRVSFENNRFFRSDDVPASVTCERPLLLNPVNPRENMLRGVRINYFRDCARYTISRLKGDKKMKKMLKSRNQLDVMLEIFRIQSTFKLDNWKLSLGRTPAIGIHGHRSQPSVYTTELTQCLSAAVEIIRVFRPDASHVELPDDAESKVRSVFIRAISTRIDIGRDITFQLTH